MAWSKRQISQHIKVAHLLYKVKGEVLIYLKQHPQTTEYQAQQFILKLFKLNSLINEVRAPIVAFRRNTSLVHYFPTKYSQKLKPNSLILLDIWARLKEKDAPYADITWMAYYGKQAPNKIASLFNMVIKARDASIAALQKSLTAKKLPSGRAIDAAARDYITRQGFGQQFLHSAGHVLGTRSPHGAGGRIKHTNPQKLKTNLGYTIEPGIYLPGRFGVRSEINIIISKNFKLTLTTPPQKKIVLI